MILLRLLSTGKTLVGVGQKERSYRLPEERLLPRFKVKKNPFRATTLPEPPRQCVEEAPPKEASASKPVTECPCAPESERPVSVSATVHHKQADQQSRATQWLKVLKGLYHRNRPGRTEQASDVHARASQGELRLESVQVVRNDLTETDIDIVPRKIPDGELARKASAIVVKAGSESESAWDRVSARIFGPNNVS